MCGCLSHAPHWGPGPQPRHVPSLGIKPKTLWFTARAQSTELHQPVLKTVFLNSSILMPFSASAIFCFTFSTLAKRVSLRTSFVQGNKQARKAMLRRDRVNGEGGARAQTVFGQRLLNIQPGVGGYVCKLHIMKGANVLKESSNKVH